jgi:hypothetical protein
MPNQNFRVQHAFLRYPKRLEPLEPVEHLERILL